MSYKVHRFDIGMETDSVKLDAFLDGLDGEIVSIIPNVGKTTLAQIYGVTRRSISSSSSNGRSGEASPLENAARNPHSAAAGRVRLRPDSYTR